MTYRSQGQDGSAQKPLGRFSKADEGECAGVVADDAGVGATNANGTWLLSSL